MMRKPNKFRQAPLASFESFLSLETDEREESREMRELHWNFTNNNHQQMSSHPPDPQHLSHNQLQLEEEKCLDEPWLTSEFSQMTRKQQNCEIYRVKKYVLNFRLENDKYILGCSSSSYDHVIRSNSCKGKVGGFDPEERHD